MNKKRIEQLQRARRAIKRRLSLRSDDPEFQRQWRDELRVIETKLQDAGVRLRRSR